jgi:hypothetical protein
LLLFLCLTAALPAGGKKEKVLVVQVTGRVRLVGSAPMPELVITGPDKSWYINMKNANKLAGNPNRARSASNQRFAVPLLIAALALAAVFSFAACHTGTSPDPTSASYSGYDPSPGDRYILTISSSGRAAYSPKDEDNYRLTRVTSGGVSKTSTGTIIVLEDGRLILTASNNSGALAVRVSESGIELIYGGLDFDDGSPLDCPGYMEPGTPPRSEPDTWTEVTSWPQLNGEWKRSSAFRKTVQEYKGGLYYQQDLFGADAKMIIGSEEDLEIDIDADTMTGTFNGKPGWWYTFLGSQISANWEEIIKELDARGFPKAYSDDLTHTLIQDSAPYQPGFIGTVVQQFPNGLYINQNKTKLKEPESSTTPEMIYLKQR